jgi:hypothetical protein
MFIESKLKSHGYTSYKTGINKAVPEYPKRTGLAKSPLFFESNIKKDNFSKRSYMIGSKRSLSRKKV